MASRQSQLHSYQFVVQRAVSALVARDPDPAQSPFRRVGGAAFASTMIGMLALAAVGIYGLVVAGGNTSWKTQGAVIVERETGAKFVYLADGKLHPVLNFASALLVAGSSDPKTISVSGKSLAGAARGTPLGIPGAPDSLPPQNRLLGRPWTVCSSLVQQSNGSLSPQSALLVGQGAGAGHTVGRTEALFVRVAGEEYMIYNSRKHHVPAGDQRVVHDALVVRPDQIGQAATAFLNSLPSGTDLAQPPIRGHGRSAVPGFKTGDVATVPTPAAGTGNYVALADGLALITQLQANLLASGHATVRQESPSWLSAQPTSHTTLTESDRGAALPAQPPTILSPPDDHRPLCAVFDDDSGVPGIVVDSGPLSTDQATVTGSQSGTGTALADRILVTPGRGAVVEAVASADAASGTRCLITDIATVYPVPGQDVLDTLGYRGATPVRVPASLVALLPRGRPLDPDAARAPAVGG